MLTHKKIRVLLIGIGAIIVIVILLGAYFASQPEVKWWKPEKEMEKPVLNSYPSIITVYRNYSKEDYIWGIDKYAGNFSTDKNFETGIILKCSSYAHYVDDVDELRGNLTAYAERQSGDYILQKLVISYKYGSEEEYEYTGISYVDTYVFRGANLWYDRTYNPHGGDNMEYLWDYEHKLVGVNKDQINAGFYGVSFALQIFLHDSLSRHLSHTITFTVTAYYGHPSLLGWTDMHELKTQVVLKIVPGGEKE